MNKQDLIIAEAIKFAKLYKKQKNKIKYLNKALKLIDKAVKIK